MLTAKLLHLPLPSLASVSLPRRRGCRASLSQPDRNSPSTHAADPEPSPKPNSTGRILDPPARTSGISPPASSQLRRWSRARSIRSGRRLERPDSRPKAVDLFPSVASPGAPPVEEETDQDDEDEENARALLQGKPIYMLSDGTGWTAERSVNAALGQFEHCLVDRGCGPVRTHLFSGVDNVERVLEIIKQAAKEGGLLLYTLADPSMAESAKQACKLWGVPCADILQPTTEAIATHLGVAPSGIPRGAPGRKVPLGDEYFRRIEAIDFTIKQDDGAQPENLYRANIVLVGVSRTGKTPLSIYLAQKGYKVANVPIVLGVELPKSLFAIKQEKIFGLTINPVILQAIRKARARALGFRDEFRSNYSEMDHVKEELEYANRIFAQNPAWPVIEVTDKAIEETAAIVVRMYHDRKNKCLMPGISKRY